MKSSKRTKNCASVMRIVKTLTASKTKKFLRTLKTVWRRNAQRQKISRRIVKLD